MTAQSTKSERWRLTMPRRLALGTSGSVGLPSSFACRLTATHATRPVRPRPTSSGSTSSRRERSCSERGSSRSLMAVWAEPARF